MQSKATPRGFLRLQACGAIFQSRSKIFWGAVECRVLFVCTCSNEPAAAQAAGFMRAQPSDNPQAVWLIGLIDFSLRDMQGSPTKSNPLPARRILESL